MSKVDDPYESLRSLLDLSGKCDDLSEDDIIVIKPNLCDLGKNAVTEIDMLEYLIEYLRTKTHARIVVAESDHWVATADQEFEYFDLPRLVQNFSNVELMNLSRAEQVEVAVSDPNIKTLKLPRLLLAKNVKLISIATPKTHTMYRLSCTMKNQFGLLPRRIKSHYHPYMNEVLLFLSTELRPFLCIVDARKVMEGAGPAYGVPKYYGVFVVGDDPVVVDTYIAKQLGLDPRSIPYLDWARRHTGKAESIRVIGDNPRPLNVAFIPEISYGLNRLSIWISRRSRGFSTRLNGLASLLADSSIGYIVLKDDGLSTFRFGRLRRRVALRYAMGLVSRHLTRLSLILHRV